MNQLTTIILATALFCACGNNSTSNSPNILELSETEVIKIETSSPYQIRADQAKLLTTHEMLDMTSAIDYIKLDSSEPMGDQIRMIVTKDKILILDAYTTEQIFVFDKTGKLLFRIKNKGRGPNEFLSIRDMQVDTIRNEIMANDALGCSYLYFSYDDGKFLRREKGVVNCNLVRFDSLYINNQIPGQDFNDKENWAILISDKDSILSKGFEPTPLQDGNFSNYSFSFDCDGGLLYTPVYSDTVYQFKSPSTAFAKYVIQQEKSVWELYDQRHSSQEVNKLIEQNNFTTYCGVFLASDNYAAFEIVHKYGDLRTLRSYFWDKRTDLVYAWDPCYGDENTLIREIIGRPIAVYGNTFYSTFSPAIPEEYRKDLNPKLKKMLDDSEDGDNPIVVMYKLK